MLTPEEVFQKKSFFFKKSLHPPHYWQPMYRLVHWVIKALFFPFSRQRGEERYRGNAFICFNVFFPQGDAFLLHKFLLDKISAKFTICLPSPHDLHDPPPRSPRIWMIHYKTKLWIFQEQWYILPKTYWGKFQALFQVKLFETISIWW